MREPQHRGKVFHIHLLVDCFTSSRNIWFWLLPGNWIQLPLAQSANFCFVSYYDKATATCTCVYCCHINSYVHNCCYGEFSRLHNSKWYGPARISITTIYINPPCLPHWINYSPAASEWVFASLWHAAHFLLAVQQFLSLLSIYSTKGSATL